jgi:hypothetical protein
VLLGFAIGITLNLIALGDLQMRKGKCASGAASYEVGLDSVQSLSPTQKVIKGLMGIRRRLTGTGVPPAEKKEE